MKIAKILELLKKIDPKMIFYVNKSDIEELTKLTGDKEKEFEDSISSICKKAGE